MEITLNHQHDDCALLKLSGRLEGGAYLTLKRAFAPWLRRPGVRQIKLDLQDVDGLGPGAIGALIVLDERVNAAGRTLRLFNGRGPVRQTLEAAGLRVSVWVP